MVYDTGAEQVFQRTIKLEGKKLYVVGKPLLTHFQSSHSYNSYSSSVSVGAMAEWLRYWISNPGVPCSKPLSNSKIDSTFHPSTLGQIQSTESLLNQTVIPGRPFTQAIPMPIKHNNFQNVPPNIPNKSLNNDNIKRFLSVFVWKQK